jgi:hypothetical protein
MDECDIKMRHVTLQIFIFTTDGISESVYVLEFAQSRVTFVRLFFMRTPTELSIQRPGYDNKNIIIIEKLSIHLCE